MVYCSSCIVLTNLKKMWKSFHGVELVLMRQLSGGVLYEVHKHG